MVAAGVAVAGVAAVCGGGGGSGRVCRGGGGAAVARVRCTNHDEDAIVLHGVDINGEDVHDAVLEALLKNLRADVLSDGSVLSAPEKSRHGKHPTTESTPLALLSLSLSLPPPSVLHKEGR